MDSIWSGHPLVAEENYRHDELLNLTKCSGFSWYEHCHVACLICEERTVKELRRGLQRGLRWRSVHPKLSMFRN